MTITIPSKSTPQQPPITATDQVNIICVDTNYRYLFFNEAHKDAMYKAWGTDIAVGSNLLESITNESCRKLAHQSLNRALAGETFVESKKYGDIERHEWESVYNPLFNPKGDIIGVSVYSTDLTERIRAEKKVTEKEKKIQYLFDNMTEGFALCEIICDDNNAPYDYRILEVNKAYEEQTGIKGSDIVGKTVLEFFPDIEKSWIEIYGEIALTQKPRTFINYNHNTSRYYETSAFSPKKGLFALLFRDTTERKNIERKLSQAIEHAGSSIIITDKEGIIEYVNPSFEAISGYTAAEAIGRTPSLIKSNKHTSDFYKNIWATIKKGDTWQGKIIDKKKDGSLFTAVVNIAPILDEAGEVTHFVGSHSDLTELEEMEQQFHQAQKMEAMGTLVGGIAHDFNNVLAGITGNAYLAKSVTSADSNIQKYLDNIENLGFRSADLIQQLLTFARKDRVSMKPLSLTSYIKDICALIQASVPENIELHAHFCEDPLPIKGDITQLHQVLINLINNARDAVEGRENPSITINLDLLDSDTYKTKSPKLFKANHYAHLSVSDSGCGIPQHLTEHLFEPFFTTKETGQGTGLGLAMVFGAIERHHGIIEVESQEGRGSTFHVYLPLIGNGEVASKLPKAKITVKGEKEWILVVDDESIIRDISTEILKKLGYNVLTASDGLDAMTVFTANKDKIALVIMDIVMPKRSGISTAKQLRKIQPEIKIIFSTGYDSAQNRDKQKLKANEIVLSKPYNIEIFSKIIKTELTTHGS